MRTVTVGFSKPKNKLFPIFSWAIRAFEGTKYSHVYLKWTSSSGPTVVYEASGTRVRFMNEKLFNEISDPVHEYTFVISNSDYKKLIRFVMENVGTEYGTKQVIGIALVKIFNLKKNPFSDGRASQVCSETVAYFLRDVLRYRIDFDVEIAGPKRIRERIEKIKKNSEVADNV